MGFQVIGDFSIQNQPGDINGGVDYFANTGGVVFIDQNSLKVSEKSGTPSMSVDIAVGEAIVPYASYTLGSGAQRFFRFRLGGTSTNVTISANVSGLSRITSIFAKVNTAAADSTRGEAAGSIVALDGTPAASPTATATPANHVKLADITVIHNASSITNANITDRRVEAKFRSTLFDEVILDNTKKLYTKDASGNTRTAVQMTSADVFQFGDGVKEVGLKTIAKARMYRNAVQSINSGSETTVIFNTKSFDVGTNYNTTTGVFTVPTTGYYAMNGSTFWGNLAVNVFIRTHIQVNGTATARAQIVSQASTDDLSTQIGDFRFLTAGDQVRMTVQHDNAGARDVGAGEELTYFAIRLESI